MKNDTKSDAMSKARRVLGALKQYRWPAIGVAWIVGVACTAVIPFVPERFEASSRIYVDTQTVLKPLMVGLAYQPDVDQQVRMLARTLISRPNVSELLDQPDIGFDVGDPKHREETITRLMGQIRVVAAERGNLYTISYRDIDGERARKLVDSTVTLFMNKGVDGKKQDSVEASKFIGAQIASTEAKLTEAENRVKEFKVRNFGVSGVSNQDYFARMSTLSDEVAKLRTDLAAAEMARDAYRRELAGEDPQLPASLPAGPIVGPVAQEIDVRLEAQRKHLDELRQRFTEAHPDVRNAIRQLAALEEEKRHMASAKGPDGMPKTPGAPGTAATSPVYQKLRFALAESEAQVASLRSQLTAQTARLAQVRALAGRVPEVEAELAQLNRDYDVIRKNYDLLVGRRESASLGVKLDESSQLADFRVVEPPRVSPSPVFPGRLHLACIALLLSAAAGIATALVLDLLRPTVSSVKDLETLSARPVLGAVTFSMTPAKLRQSRLSTARFAGATTLLCLAQVGLILWIATRMTTF